MVENLSLLTTEMQNPLSMDLDLMSTRQILELMNEEDKKVIQTIHDEIPNIEKTVNAVIDTLNKGGRLIYIGAGTSGRLGIIDAVECLPTFSATYEVQGLIAGGEGALIKAVEGAEDSLTLAKEDLKKINLSDKDTLVAIAASGRTPYCIGALEYAKEIGAKTVSIACNKNTKISKYAEINIETCAGPEILTGSTRLKSGTTQKLVLNMISTASMVGIGKVYKNLMVDMIATNIKLVDRAKRIVKTATGCDDATAENALKISNGKMKQAIVMILTNCDLDKANELLDKNKGFVRKCV